MRLVEEDYWLWKGNSSCRCWFVLQDLLGTRYAPHLLFTDFQETLEDIQKIIEDITIKVETDPEPPIFAEPEAVDQPQPQPDIVDEPELEVEEPLIETLVELPVEPIMELVPSLTAIPLSSPDVYNPMQIFLQETGSQEISLFIVQSAVRSVFIMND